MNHPDGMIAVGLFLRSASSRGMPSLTNKMVTITFRYAEVCHNMTTKNLEFEVTAGARVTSPPMGTQVNARAY